MSRAQDSYVENLLITPQDLFLRQLALYTLVDTGVIRRVRGHHCAVMTNRLTDGIPAVYDGVEILMPGGISGGFAFDPEGAACLLFFPRSSSDNIVDRTYIENRPYDIGYAKCIPIGTVPQWISKVFVDTDGNTGLSTPGGLLQMDAEGQFTFIQPAYTFSASPKGTQTLRKEGTYRTSLADGSFYRLDLLPPEEEEGPQGIRVFESYQKEEDLYLLRKEPIEYEFDDSSEDTEWEQLLAWPDWQYELKREALVTTVSRKNVDKFLTAREIIEADGSVTKIVYNGTEEDETKGILSKEELLPDGSRKLTILDGSDTMAFERTIAADGKINIAVGENYTLQIDPDGTVAETNAGAKTIASKGGIKLDGQDGKVVVMNAAKSLLTIMNAFVDGVLGANPVSLGSPAAHTAWGPNVIKAFQDCQADLGELLSES